MSEILKEGDIVKFLWDRFKEASIANYPVPKLKYYLVGDVHPPYCELMTLDGVKVRDQKNFENSWSYPLLRKITPLDIILDDELSGVL